MRVWMGTRYFSRLNGGIGECSQKLLNEMLVRGHEVDPVCTTRRGIVGYLLYTGVEIRFRIPRDVDVYHALTPLESIYLPKKKTVSTFYDLIPWLHRKEETWYFSGVSGRFKRWAGGWWFRRACRKAAKSERIICISEQTKREVMENLKIDEDKITVARLGISRDLRPKPKKHDGIRIGTLSYLDPRKRIEILIKAFKAANLDDAELLIAGKGPDESRLRRIAGDDPQIKFLGFVPEGKKAAFYKSLNVFGFTSLLEGYGLPPVEAMACGVPVITLDDALIPSDIKSHTHICTLKELPGILANQEVNCDVPANLKFAEGHDWGKFADETEKVYKEVVK